MTYALRLITDTHIAKAIAVQLRNKGIDVVRLEELDALPTNAADSAILKWATDNQRAVLSLDRDFRKLHSQWLAENKQHNGIFSGSHELQGEKGIGTIVNFMTDYAQYVDDMTLIENDLIYVD